MFTRFFEAHYDQVYNYAWRRIGPDYADDVAAEALTVAWRRFAEIPADRPLLWLYGCARRIALAKQREIRRRGEAFRLFDETGSGLAAPDDCEQIIQRSTALSALAGLNSSERELVMLVTWEGLEPREAAKVAGCSHVAARVRLHRARKRIESSLADTGASTPRTAATAVKETR
ncbi:RNA polymerase sigma factor [Allosalinactinospora lopnorensis]|uniref:RNA polymerase sigma factor n=1 Tax=Allosalinactinospora lopnorensis TaxID=1352348 RepID=UPI000623D718|nr:RNA polymerase sigma factor [Allosalinactinospora lopnorensis]